MIRRHIAALNVLGLIVAAAAVGCSDDKQPTYGSKLAGSQAPMASPMDDALPPNMIPAGAKKLSQGTYNQIMFTVPNGDGSLYVYDVSTRQICGQTNSVESMAGKSMTMADLKNTAQGLNMTDRYQVYFAPSVATTKPISGM